MIRQTKVLKFCVIALLLLGLVGCSDLHINIDVDSGEATTVVEVTPTPTPTETLSAEPLPTEAEAPAATQVPGATATPSPQPAAAADTSSQESTSTSASEAEAPTETQSSTSGTTTEDQSSTSGTTTEDQSSTSGATTQEQAPTPVPATPVPPPTPTRQPLMPTPPPCESYQGQTYTVVLNEQEINAMLDAVLQVTERAYISTRSVSLQNGQITAQTQYKGPAGKTVDGVLVVAVTAKNYDLHVAIVKAQVGQAGMTDARKAAINTAFERALETEMAQAHDYTCVDAVTIANGTMTIVYH